MQGLTAPPRDDTQRLRDAVDRAAHLLPAQGPISVFIHHNTLHAFEHLPFERAVVEAGARFACEPFLPEARYRELLAAGRILERDLDEVLGAELGPDERAQPIAGLTTRHALRRALLRSPLVHTRGAELRWMLAETDGLGRLRVPGARALWQAARSLGARAARPPRPTPAPVRHRDLLLAVTGDDADAIANPFVIRLAAAFLDQGVAHFGLPERSRGLYLSARALYAGAAAGLLDAGLAAVPALLEEDRRADRDAASSAVASLRALGVAPGEWEAFVTDTLLVLRGWAGIVHLLAERPDRAPVKAPPASLVDLLAVRLVADRAAAAFLARDRLRYGGDLARLRDWLRPRVPPPEPADPEAQAWTLFQVAERLGLAAADLDRLDAGGAAALLDEIEAFGDGERRRLFHLAYERRHAVEVLDALAAHAPEPGPARPRFQAIFCIDEREESLRRHLEEVAPACETFGAPGFFGVAMYYRGVADAHMRPLGPIAIRPQHEVVERLPPQLEPAGRRRALGRRLLGRLAREWTVGSRTFTRGTLVTGLFGALAGLPLVLRVLFPRLAARLRRRTGALLRPPERTVLALDRHDAPATLGRFSGYTTDEMAAIVRRLLEDIGLVSGFAPIVIVVGHGSSSLNNPHESAHDCGACGGGRGGPNARALARMANRPAVRRTLADQGLVIPESTAFVGAYHNTCDGALTLYDTDRLPPEAVAALDPIAEALDEARARDAHERCRRFENAPPAWLGVASALRHVEARAEDLAQPRPEYGHATNALCIVGRRRRTRGLFLDRRAFLISYDPTADDAEGTILGRILSAAAPVGAGISLEYYFSFVDPTGYGCGTKLPHNITALLGVMDGHQSDLRTGLPWQMVEIHEPVRLLVVVEAPPERLARVVARDEGLARLVRNRWIRVATLDPEGPAIHVLGDRGFAPHGPERLALPVARSSAAWYGGRREHLPCARIVPPAPEETP